MFSVEIRVVPGIVAPGLQALDERRRLGLPESATRLMENGEAGSFQCFKTPVTETFARDREPHFRHRNLVKLKIRSSKFHKGELEEERGMLRLAAPLPEWRLVELFPVGIKSDTATGEYLSI